MMVWGDVESIMWLNDCTSELNKVCWEIKVFLILQRCEMHQNCLL